MKYKVLFFLIVFQSQVFSQNDNHHYFDINKDTIIFYFNDVGDVTIKSKASYFRKTQIENKSFLLKKRIDDYYINGKIAYQAHLKFGYLNGEANEFYKNGKIKYSGFYKKSLKDSIWIFYYKNGNIEKKVIFRLDTPYVKEFYKKRGKVIFDNGNGKYTGNIISGFKQKNHYKISGNIKNGRFDGKWIWTDNNTNATEYFDNGKFIKGSSYGLVYSNNPKISLLGFNIHENVDIFRFVTVYNTNNLNIKLLKYKDNINLNLSLRNELNEFLMKLIYEKKINDFWSFCQFDISKNSQVENVKVYSNSKLITSKMTEYISNLSDFESSKSYDKSISSSVYICIYAKNGKIFIPKYNPINSEYNITNLNIK